MGVSPALPVMDYGPLDEVEGLKVHDGIMCTLCDKPLLKERSMHDHHLQAHPGLPTPKTWPAIKVQQLDAALSRSYFRVVPSSRRRSEPLDPDVVIHNLRAEMHEAARDQPRTVNTRMVSPWLLTTKWHEHTRGYSVPELRRLVQYPKKDLVGLRDFVIHLLRHASDLIEQCSELILQRLNTPDPAKT
jgi:hypothetical protein